MLAVMINDTQAGRQRLPGVKELAQGHSQGVSAEACSLNPGLMDFGAKALNHHFLD